MFDVDKDYFRCSFEYIKNNIAFTSEVLSDLFFFCLKLSNAISNEPIQSEIRENCF